MSGLGLGMVSASLLLMGVALLLWQGASARNQRASVSMFADRQLGWGVAVAEASVPGVGAERSGWLDSPRWNALMLRSGVKSPRRFVTLGTLALVGGSLVAWLLLGPLAAVAVALLSVVLGYFWLWMRTQKRAHEMARQLPIFLDGVVRLVTIGNSLPSALQELAPALEQPLGDVLVRASQLNQAGVELDVALRQMGRLYEFEELFLVASVIGVSTRFGGRVDTVLERMALFMRDIQQAHQELVALSAEIRVSAWILALLPVAVAIFLLVFNDSLFRGMWVDPIGKKMLVTAVALQLIGSFWLYRLAKAI